MVFFYIHLALVWWIGSYIIADDLPICPVFDHTYAKCMITFQPHCDCFDWDRDKDVDMRDFAVAQNNFWRI